MEITSRLEKSETLVIIIIICVISAITRLAIDSYLPSLPAISRALGVSGNDIQLTLTFYMLGFGLSQLIYGPLSDRYGRKHVLIVGLLIYLLANTYCATTESLPMLLFARLLAGIGIGACGVLNRAIASDCFSGAEFSTAWSYTTTTLVLVLMIAPFIGSCMQSLFDWRANFIMTTVLVSIALIVIYWKLPETNHEHRLKSLDLVTVFNNYHEILSSSSFIANTTCYTLAFAGLIAYFQVSPLLLCSKFNLTPMEYGYSSIIIATSYLAGGIIVNRWAKLLGTQKMLVIGMLLLCSSGLIMLFWNSLDEDNILSILFPTTIYVIGARLVIPNAIASAFVGLRQMGGSTSGLIGSIQILGSALISFLIANFNYDTPLPLAVFLTTLGFISLSTFVLLGLDDFAAKKQSAD